MSNLLQLQTGSKSYGVKSLFADASFAINEGEHVGVIGPNGAGKTTLFKILANQESLDGGSIVKSKSLELGYLPQYDTWAVDDTVETYLAQAYQTPLWELKALGKKLGLEESVYARPIQSLSGGYRMRCKLLFLLGQRPSLMLLDEPTNYLDLETTLVLEQFLQDYAGAFLLISHDREFLRRTTDHILEIERGDITKFNGNLDDYFEQKSMLRSQLEARALSLNEKREEILKFVARFGAKASKAKQAQSRLKSLSKMETIELKPLSGTAAIRLPEPVRTGKVILTLENARLGYGDRVVLEDVNLLLQNGDHLAVVGLNGAGKSTLLKALSGNLEVQSGKKEFGYQVSIGYYAQHVAENLISSQTVFEQIAAKAHPDVTRQEILDMAGSLLFSGDDIKKKISVLSGGEKSRVALGQILLQKAPCLILDEPTNHLDFQTVEALTQALSAFKGTLVVVSHDRGFIGRIGTKILEIDRGRVRFYPGTYDEYVWSLQKGSLSQNESREAEENQKQGEISAYAGAPEKARFNYKEVKKNLDRQLKQCDKALSDLDEQLQTLHERLISLNESIANGNSTSEKIEELGIVQSQTESAESQWLVMSEKREQVEREILALNLKQIN